MLLQKHPKSVTPCKLSAFDLFLKQTTHDTAVMAGNDTFQQNKKHHTIQKNIHNSAKTYDILFKQKGLSLGSDFTISEKKVFCFGRGLWGPHFYCTSWTEKQVVQEFFEILAKFFQNYWIPIKVFNIN